MADSLSPDPDDCFYCPQGDKPCPATYRPTSPGHGWRIDLPSQRLRSRTAPSVLATSRPASSRPYADCTKPWQATPDDLASLPADMKST
jgi:hypothetical protein